MPFFKIGTIGGTPDAYITRDLFEEYKAKYNYPHEGEVMITCAGTVGKTIVFDGEDAYFQDSNIVWLSNPKQLYINSFLNYVLSRVNWNILNSTTITRIYNDNLRELVINYPSIKEQEKIVALLSLLDRRIAIQNNVKEVISKTVPYSEDTLFKNIPEDIRTLYEKFRDGILELDSEIIIKFTKLYAAFKKNGSNVCDLEPFKGSLCIFINSEKGSLRDENGLAVDVSNLGHHGNGDYRIQIRDADQYEYILSLIKQAIK